MKIIDLGRLFLKDIKYIQMEIDKNSNRVIFTEGGIRYSLVLINTCYGGFGISNKARYLYKQLTGNKLDTYSYDCRNDALVIKIVLRLGKVARDSHAKLKICLVPEFIGNHFKIHEYDGLESLSLNIDRYKIERISDICDDTNKSSDVRIREINEVLKMEIPKVHQIY